MRDYNHKRGDKRDTVAWNATWALYKKSHYMPPVMPRWRHNWKSAQVVNSHLVCDPTIRQQGFDLPWQQWSLLNRFRTEQGHCGACRRKWRLTDTDMCVLVARLRRCLTLSNPVPWQSWTVAYLGYTLQIRYCFLADQLWFTTHIREEENKTSRYSLRIMLTSLAPSPMARVTAFFRLLMRPTTRAFCSGVTRQQMTARHWHATSTNSCSIDGDNA